MRHGLGADKAERLSFILAIAFVVLPDDGDVLHGSELGKCGTNRFFAAGWRNAGDEDSMELLPLLLR